MALALIFFYLGQRSQNLAYSEDGSVSGVALLASVQVALAIPITWLGSLVCGDCLGTPPCSWLIWLGVGWVPLPWSSASSSSRATRMALNLRESLAEQAKQS